MYPRRALAPGVKGPPGPLARGLRRRRPAVLSRGVALRRRPAASQPPLFRGDHLEREMLLPLVALGGGGDIVGDIVREGDTLITTRTIANLCSTKTILKPSDIFEHDSPRVFLLAGSKICSKILKVAV